MIEIHNWSVQAPGMHLLFVIAVIGVLWLISLIFKIAFALLAPILIWMLAGMIAGRLVRGRGYGPVGDILLGFVGGVVGSVLLRLIGLGWLGDIWLVGSIIVGVLGAVLTVYAVRLLADKNFAA
jgi:uncharacterized membrane protein YeaQ/YmgE (transglycosylase-associated protein family)